ncbi:MAG: ATP-binding protein [Lachnospiraceae bacterium]|jgi:predicted AAA+ superfamily ATPase|nr:ATP-binding protein [Lachnospiraceae bacterium]
MYLARAIEDTIVRNAKGFKAILVTGPRQVGKSTILKHLYEDIQYVTFDDPVLLEETKREPGLFFRNHKPPIILDEVQYITELFPYLKMECDKSDENGKIFLTGSQQYHLMHNISESLAGRIGIFELSGISYRELTQDSFREPFLPTLSYIESKRQFFQPCRDIWEIIHRGSYPALLTKETDVQTFYSSYVQTYRDRDINALGHIQDKLKFTRFLTVMAARTGQLLNYSKVAEHVDISVSTVREWTSLLETSGIIYLLQPFSNSALTRAIKTPKLYFRYTGLICYLTKYQTAQTAMNGAMAGELFETYVVSEILKSYANAGKDYRMYVTFYRGKDKLRKSGSDSRMDVEAEIDLLIEQDDTIYPIEIKMSANPKLHMTNAFDVLDRIPGKKRGTGGVVCMYSDVLWLNDNVVALPVEYV